MAYWALDRGLKQSSGFNGKGIEMANYWESFTRNRISRRRAFAVAGGGMAGAALLAACGGSDSGSSSNGGSNSTAPAKNANSLIADPIDTTASAKQGGTLKHYATIDTSTFDCLADNGSAPLSMGAAFAYPRLLKYKLAKFPKDYDGTFEGDLAESWEVSPDKLQITLKMRQGVKWDSRAPTNNRIADANDVVKSWEKFTTVNPGRNVYAYNAQSAPTAPILSLTATDANTIVVKLREPDSSSVPQFAQTTFSIMPKEFDGGFDPKQTVRGHGPYTLDEYVPSGRFVWKRNPDYYVKGKPYIDRIEMPIITEYAARLAQYKAGNIHTDIMGAFGGGQADIIPTKRDNNALLLLKASSYPTQNSWQFSFGYDGAATPFKDQRMRQAASMLIDREGYIDVIDNRDGFKKDGLDLDVVYGTVISAGWSGYWIDPKDTKTFGDTAKYLSHNVDEAKKLISAAGYNGQEIPFHYNSSPAFPIQAKIVELYAAMFQDGGLKIKQDGIANAQQYQDNYYYGYQSPGYAQGTKKGFDGIAMGQERPYSTVSVNIFGALHKDGPYYHGLSPDGTHIENGDPKVNDWAQQIKAEFDVQKQQSLTHDLIKYFTGQSYYVPQPSQAKGFSLWWPVIGNNNVFSNGVSPNYWTENRLDWWIDPSKPPLKS